MKKILIISILLFSLMLASCSEPEEPETTKNIGYGTHPYIDPLATSEAEEELTMTDIFPLVIDVTAPEELIIRVADIDFDSFTEIDIEDSFVPEGGHDKVLESENAQYFFVDDDIKIHAVFFVADGENRREITASASYNTETGVLEFYGDESRTWYFDENGELKCLVLTYDGKKHDLVPVYGFYDNNGELDVLRSSDGWFENYIYEVTEEETLLYIEKYTGTIEATASYSS